MELYAPLLDAQALGKPFVTDIGQQSHVTNVETITPPPKTLPEVPYTLSMQDEDITPLLNTKNVDSDYSKSAQRYKKISNTQSILFHFHLISSKKSLVGILSCK